MSERVFVPVLLLLPFLLLGCAHRVELLNVADGTTITGQSTLWNRVITLTLPSGEVMKGHFMPLTTALLGEGSLFYGANVGAMMERDISGRFHGYAHLTGEKGTVMEIVFSSDWTGHGFGVAKTNRGEEYLVTF